VKTFELLERFDEVQAVRAKVSRTRAGGGRAVLVLAERTVEVIRASAGSWARAVLVPVAEQGPARARPTVDLPVLESRESRQSVAWGVDAERDEPATGPLPTVDDLDVTGRLQALAQRRDPLLEGVG